MGIRSISSLESKIGRTIREWKLEKSDINLEVYESLRTSVEMDSGTLGEEGSADTSKMNVIIGTALGGLMGFLMYMVIFIYGGMVMRSVMEEKVSRIAEVMISSVKPFQMMLGKIIGVGAVGLTQLTVWLILIPVIIILAQTFLGIDSEQLATISMNEMNSTAIEEMQNYEMAKILAGINSQNWALIIPSFILYFLGGYFIYSALFAAIGSAIGEDLGESQSLMIPIVIPVIIAFMLTFNILESPNSPMAVFGSIFPLFSPINMPARLAFNPPLWQLGVSLIVLLVSCWGIIWLSGRIYRVGILMYGKKASLKELAKWIFYKN